MAQNETIRSGYPGGLMTGLAALAAVGAGTFAWTAMSSPQQAWLIYLVNFTVFSGLVSGAVALAAIFEVSGARWLRVVRLAAESCSAALPALPILLLITWLGRGVLMPWAAPDSGVHKAWLDVTSVYLRGTIGLAVMAGLGIAFTRKSQQEGFGAARGLAMGYLFAFVIVTTIQAIDMLMALDPHWVSSLFGGHVFSGNIYAGVGLAYLLTAAMQRWLGGSVGLPLAFQMNARSNMAKMLFSFAMIWLYMFWSQHLVIWYGNLPAETGYMTLRLTTQPWETLAYIVFLLNFILPFVLLIPRSAKLNQPLLLALSFGVILGTWLERFIIAAPQLLPDGAPLLSVPALLITAGFAAAFLLMVLTSLKRVSMLEMNDVRASE